MLHSLPSVAALIMAVADAHVGMKINDQETHTRAGDFVFGLFCVAVIYLIFTVCYVLASRKKEEENLESDSYYQYAS